MIILVILVLCLLAYHFTNYYLNEKAPPEQFDALLVQKKKSTNIDSNNVTQTTYYLVFEFNKTRKKFCVRHKIYKQYQEKQQGLLSFKRKRFVSFEPYNN